MSVFHSNSLSPIFRDLYLSTSRQQKYFDSNFLLFVYRLGRAPWQTRMASGWRGYVWAIKKSGAFRDSAHNGLQSASGIHINKTLLTCSSLLHKEFTYISTTKITRHICKQELMPDRILIVQRIFMFFLEVLIEKEQYIYVL
jgi:hypothetical protein